MAYYNIFAKLRAVWPQQVCCWVWFLSWWWIQKRESVGKGDADPSRFDRAALEVWSKLHSSRGGCSYGVATWAMTCKAAAPKGPCCSFLPYTTVTSAASITAHVRWVREGGNWSRALPAAPSSPQMVFQTLSCGFGTEYVFPSFPLIINMGTYRQHKTVCYSNFFSVR